MEVPPSPPGIDSKPQKRRKWWIIGVLLAAGIAWGIWRSTPPPHPPQVIRSQLRMQDSRLCWAGDGRPYSGLLVETQPGTNRQKSLLPLMNGRIHGTVQGYHPDGSLEVTETFQDGVSHGIRTRWHPNGKKRSEANIVQGQITGLFTEWHDNGVKAVEMTFAAGKAEGTAEAWYPSGAPKSKALMKGGKALEQKFFPENPAGDPPPIAPSAQAAPSH